MRLAQQNAVTSLSEECKRQMLTASTRWPWTPRTCWTPWTKPRSWPTWPAHWQSEEGRRPLPTSPPHPPAPPCSCPCPCPCLAFGPVGPLGEEGRRVLPLAVLHDPSPPPYSQTVLPRLQLDRGDSGLPRTPGNYKEAQRSMAAAHQPSYLAQGVTWQSLVAKMALRRDRAGDWGIKLVLLLPAPPTEVPSP